jgi:hypothetical protein
MGVRAMTVFLSLMVINNFNFCRAGRTFRPLKTDAPLAVNPDRILALSVTFQGFEPVGVKSGQIACGRRSVQNPQPFFRLTPERLPLADLIASRKFCRVLISVIPYHSAIYLISIDE